jgi:hypothetical protein
MKHKQIDIESILFPENKTLLLDKQGGFYAELVDAELDGFKCKFNNDSCVEIDTKNLTYVTLTEGNLKTLLMLIKKTDALYKERTEAEWESYDV